MFQWELNTNGDQLVSALTSMERSWRIQGRWVDPIILGNASPCRLVKIPKGDHWLCERCFNLLSACEATFIRVKGLETIFQPSSSDLHSVPLIPTGRAYMSFVVGNNV